MIEIRVNFFDYLNNRMDVSFYRDRFNFSSKVYPSYRLSELLFVNPTVKYEKLSDNDTISFVPMEVIDEQNGKIAEQRTTTVSNTKGFTRFAENDLIWAKITPCMQNGKSAIARNLVNRYGCGSTEFYVLRPKSDNVLIEYIHFILRDKRVLESAKNSFGGSAGQQRVASSYLKSIQIPLPPIEIQQKIVDLYNQAIEEKQAKEQKSKDLLVSIDGYLLEELGIELADEVSKEKCLDVNVMELIGGRLDAIYYLPSFLNFYKKLEKVECINLGHLISSITNGFDFREYTKTGTPYIKVANVKQGEFDFSKIQYVTFSSFDVVKQIQLRKGNILLTRKGTFGNALCLNNNYDYVISSEVFNLDIKQDKINSKYIEIVLNSQIGKIQFNRNKIGAIMGSLSQEAVKQIKIPLLPKETQQKIVEHFQSVKAKAMQLQEEAGKVLEQTKIEIKKIIIGG